MSFTSLKGNSLQNSFRGGRKEQTLQSSARPGPVDSPAPVSDRGDSLLPSGGILQPWFLSCSPPVPGFQPGSPTITVLRPPEAPHGCDSVSEISVLLTNPRVLETTIPVLHRLSAPQLGFIWHFFLMTLFLLRNTEVEFSCHRPCQHDVSPLMVT